MKTTVGAIQMIRSIRTFGMIGKAGQITLSCLSATIAHKLIEHGQIELGAYMLVELAMNLLHLHNGHEAVEHALHAAAHEHRDH